MKQTNDRSDHDIIIRLDQKVSDLQIAVKEIKDGTVARIEQLEKSKADQKVTDELQVKINNLQKHVNENVETVLDELKIKTSNYTITLGLYTAVGLSMIGLIIYHMFQ